MKTCLDCIPCFLKGTLEMARLVSKDEVMHKEILDDVARLIPDLSLDITPPEMSRLVHQVVDKKIGQIDAYKDIKKKSNERALRLYPDLKKKVDRSQDRLFTALELAIAGNIIDYAAKNTFNIEEEIEKLFNDDFAHIKKTVFDYEHFKIDLDKAKTILYLADNAGEILFDRVLIEEFSKDKKVIFAVRGKPVINDALKEDAFYCGLDKVAQIISSGVDAPGTVLKYCSEEFLKIYKDADLIISKGQGNYEALSQEKENIYFLLRAKCAVIAKHAEVGLGDIVLKKGKL